MRRKNKIERGETKKEYDRLYNCPGSYRLLRLCEIIGELDLTIDELTFIGNYCEARRSINNKEK